MSTFTLPKWSSDVVVSIPSNVTKDELLAFPAFVNWLQTLKKSLEEQGTKGHIFHEKSQRYRLCSINIQHVDKVNGKILFVKMEAVVRNNADENALPGIIFLRGGSVAILVIIRKEGDPQDRRWVIMTKQPRIPAGSLTFYEIPAGMLDEDGNFSWKGAAARELKEETGLDIPAHELTNMTEKALAAAKKTESHLQKAMYPSPGGCDEYIALCMWEGTKPVSWFNEHQDKMRGTDREKIMVKLVEYEELWKEGARDAKTLAAWVLYEGLTREGSLYKTDSDAS